MNPGVSADPLAALRPIHAPPPVSWWPPAPGWWILAAVICLLLVWIVMWYLSGRVRRAALRELEGLENSSPLSDRDYAAAVSIILKRYALYCFPEQEVAPLAGRRWLEFLDSTAPRRGFVSGPGSVLADVYSTECKVDRDALTRLASQWIKNVSLSFFTDKQRSHRGKEPFPDGH